ncbi:transposase [Paenibacillaceae bacterium WGS1546]|uniref:transposase n=1 Tax=Cohnella sp. WGS1546 TaxID=3366810 RepID=UPI00372D0204
MALISVEKFMRRFPDEQTCRDFLFQVRWPRGFICTKCGESKHSVIRTRNLYECAHCGTQTSSTSGTVMHRTKLPLRYWLLTFYWIASGERCSARLLARTLQVQYRTALRLLHQVRQAISRSEFEGIFHFGSIHLADKPPVVHQAYALLRQRMDRFIRANYRRVSARYREHYKSEFRFRNNHRHHPAVAVEKLIASVFATVYEINEYRTCHYRESVDTG